MCVICWSRFEREPKAAPGFLTLNLLLIAFTFRPRVLCAKIGGMNLRGVTGTGSVLDKIVAEKREGVELAVRCKACNANAHKDKDGRVR